MSIHEAILNVMKDIGVVGKKGEVKGNSSSYSYCKAEDIINAVNYALIKNRLYIIPDVLETTREERVNNKNNVVIYTLVKVKYDFCAEDGSSIECTVVGEAMDFSDKSLSKALTSAYKTALCQMFCIHTEESPERNNKLIYGNDAKTNMYISESQKHQLFAELERTQIPLGTILDLCEISDVNQMNRAVFKKILNKLLITEDGETYGV